MYLTDYHTHSSMSFDGHAPMAYIAAAAERAGLDELCITDHCDFLDEHGRPNRAYDWDGACAQYREALAACKPGFTLRLGLEFGMSHLDPVSYTHLVVGPTRMDYAKITARLSYLAEGLSRLFGQGELPQGRDDEK